MLQATRSAEAQIQQLLDLLGLQPEDAQYLPQVVQRLVQEVHRRNSTEQRYAELYRREQSARFKAEAAMRRGERQPMSLSHAGQSR